MNVVPLFPQFYEGMAVSDPSIGTGKVFRVNKSGIRVRLNVEPSPFPFPVGIERSYTWREAKLRLRKVR
jgi:hypothetical protein